MLSMHTLASRVRQLHRPCWQAPRHRGQPEPPSTPGHAGTGSSLPEAEALPSPWSQPANCSRSTQASQSAGHSEAASASSQQHAATLELQASRPSRARRAIVHEPRYQAAPQASEVRASTADSVPPAVAKAQAGIVLETNRTTRQEPSRLMSLYFAWYCT